MAIEYTSNRPQTNISIFEYYQKLGYKYKKWIPELNKYKNFSNDLYYQGELEVIPSMIIKGEEVPKNLRTGSEIIIRTFPEGQHFPPGKPDINPLRHRQAGRGKYCPFLDAEQLLAREIVDTIPTPEIETVTGTGSWNTNTDTKGAFRKSIRICVTIDDEVVCHWEDVSNSEFIIYNNSFVNHGVESPSIIQQVNSFTGLNYTGTPDYQSLRAWLGQHHTEGSNTIRWLVFSCPVRVSDIGWRKEIEPDFDRFERWYGGYRFGLACDDYNETDFPHIIKSCGFAEIAEQKNIWTVIGARVAGLPNDYYFLDTGFLFDIDDRGNHLAMTVDTGKSDNPLRLSILHLKHHSRVGKYIKKYHSDSNEQVIEWNPRGTWIPLGQENWDYWEYYWLSIELRGSLSSISPSWSGTTEPLHYQDNKSIYDRRIGVLMDIEAKL